MLKNIRRLRSQELDLELQSEEDIEPSSGNGEGRRSRLTGIAQILLVLILMGAAIYYSRPPSAPATPNGMVGAPATDTARVPSVAIIAPVPGRHQVRVLGNGSVGVTSYVDLIPQVTGRIVKKSPDMEIGGEFSADELLVAIEPAEFQLQLRQAMADVEVQRANLQLQQAKSNAAVRNYGLINPGKTVPSLVALRPQIAQAKALLLAARSRADIAQLNLQRTQFSLPFNGKITQSNAQLGQLMTSGRSFGQAYALDSVELTVPIAQSDLAFITPIEGRRVEIVSGDQRLSAYVDRVSAELDARSRFARIFVPIPQTSGANDPTFKPGMFADVLIEGPEYENSLLLPEAALQANGKLWYIKGGQLREYEPMVLGRNASGIVIEGFDLGQGIVIGNVPGASAGMPVSPTPYQTVDA